MDFNLHMIANLTAQTKIQHIISLRSDIPPKIGNSKITKLQWNAQMSYIIWFLPAYTRK